MADVDLSTLGDRARERPEPTLKGSLAAAGGALLVIGIVLVGVDITTDGSNLPGAGMSLLAVAGGYGVLLRLPDEIRPAGVAAIALGTAAAIGFILEDDLVNGDSGTVIFLLLAVAWGAEYLIPPGRGELVFLVGALTALWFLALDLAAGEGSEEVVFEDTEGLPAGQVLSGTDDTVTYLSLFIGLGLLIGAWALDRAGWKGVATGFVIVGDIAFVVGVFGVVGTLDSDAGGSLLVVAAGVVLVFVGARGERRFTTWLGGVGVLGGLIALISTIFDSGDDIVAFGLTSAAVGATLVAGVAFLDRSSFASSGVSGTAAAPTPATATPVSGGGAWHPDPAGRHELRWWDGGAWTEQVSDGGVISTDPLA